MGKRVIITMGDPAGVGAFIIAEALADLDLRRTSFTIVGDKNTLRKVKSYRRIEPFINLIDLKNAGGAKKGLASRDSGRAAFEYLDVALGLLKRDGGYSLVTGPVSKEAIRLVKRGFSGHTEFLANRFSVNNFAMMMVGQTLKVVFLTRHILIRNVSRELNLKDVRGTLELLICSLRDLFKIKSPKIALCSLNPHAGIDTYLDKEEMILVRAKNKLKNSGAGFIGPYPSDTLFGQALKKGFDAVVVFYHDQGMIPFKSLEFSKGINLTLGLPFIRTSPAHGPAFSLVNKPYLIDYRPMKEAVKLALKLNISSE